MKTALLLLTILSSLGNTACRTHRSPQSEQDPDKIEALQAAPPASSGNPVLTVMSWNVKHLGRDLFDSRQAAPLLADADIATFQEVNVSEKGVKALRAIAQHLGELMNERMCVAISERPTEGTEVYGYIWKNSRVSFVTRDGRVIEDCGNNVVTVRLGVRHAQEIKREPAFGTFYFRPAARPFVLASIHLVPTAKKPALEVPPLFSTFKDVEQPVIVAGDFNLNSAHASFQAARDVSFAAAMVRVKTSLKANARELSKAYDNFWFRGLRLTGQPSVLNLYEVFPEKEQREIYDNFSDHCPVTAKFEFPTAG